MARYADFKSYIQANYELYLQKQILDFVSENHDAHGFHSINVLSVCDQEVDNISVKSIRCTDMPDPFIKIDINTTADIVTLGLGTKRYEADRKTRWFTITVVACLRDGMTLKEEETRIKEYAPGTWDKTTALDEFGVPYVYSADLEDIADDFVEFYCCDADYYASEFPYKHVLEALDIAAYDADLPEDNMGRMYFRDTKETVFIHDPITEELYTKEVDIHPGTMLISATNYYIDRNYGSKLLTIAHEIVHWYYHQKFFKILFLLDDSAQMMPCDVAPIKYEEGMSNLQKARWFVEWQANAIGMRIAMPQALYVDVFRKVFADIISRPQYANDKPLALEETITRTGYSFGVSAFVSKQRAIQLGLASAAGTHLYINGRYHRPFIFDDAALDIRQTYTIDDVALKKLRQQDTHLDMLLNEGLFVYLGYVVCINDDQYLQKVDAETAARTGYEYELSDYARNHADECLLAFTWESISGAKDDGGFYGQCYLSRDISVENRVEHSYNPNFENNQDIEQIAKAVAAYKKMYAEEDKILRETPAEFGEALVFHMKRKGITVGELSGRSGLSETTIKNYRAGRKPEIENMMAIFIGLNLGKTFCYDMLDIAGLSVNGRDDKQRAYKTLIEEYTDGDLDQWNDFLESYGLEPIPNIKNQKSFNR